MTAGNYAATVHKWRNRANTRIDVRTQIIDSIAQCVLARVCIRSSLRVLNFELKSRRVSHFPFEILSCSLQAHLSKRLMRVSVKSERFLPRGRFDASLMWRLRCN